MRFTGSGFRFIALACIAVYMPLIAVVASATDSNETLSILIPTSNVDDFHAFVGGRNILAIDNYGGAHSGREVAELVLLHQALYLGGYRGQIKYIAQEVDYLRSLNLIGDGHAVVYGATVWHENVSSNDAPFWVTKPLVRNGEFVVGLYTTANNSQALAVSSLADLQPLRAVSNIHWDTDWRSLQTLQLTQVYSVRNWASMARMVRAQRADFTLAPFRSTPKRVINSNDFELTPIPNVSVALAGSRHWVVSKAHPQGREVFDYLSRGLVGLRSQGSVVKAYRDSGFFQPKGDFWPAINQPHNLTSVAITTATPVASETQGL